MHNDDMDTEITPDEFRARQSAGEAVTVASSRPRVVREPAFVYTIQTARGGAFAGDGASAVPRSAVFRKQTSPGEVRTAHRVA